MIPIQSTSVEEKVDSDRQAGRTLLRKQKPTLRAYASLSSDPVPRTIIVLASDEFVLIFELHSVIFLDPDCILCLYGMVLFSTFWLDRNCLSVLFLQSLDSIPVLHSTS